MKKLNEHYSQNQIKYNSFIILILLFSVTPFVYYNQQSIAEFLTNNKLLTGYIGMLGAITTLAFAGYQSIMQRRQHIKGHELSRRVKAIELAREYKVLLDNEFSYIVAGMKTIGVSKVMEKYGFEKLSEFDKSELDETISEDDRLFLKNAVEKLDSEKLSIVYCRYNKNFKAIIDDKRKRYMAIDKANLPDFKSIQEKLRKSRSMLSKDEVEQLKKDIYELKTYAELSKDVMEEDLMITSDFFDKLDSTMNNLEWFSMHFKNSVADDEVVYQSLHQSFINLVRLIYPIISDLNVVPYEKYYINTIWLYNHWVNKMMTKKNEHINFKKGQIIDKKEFKV